MVKALAPMLEEAATGVLVRTANLAREVFVILPKEGKRLLPMIRHGEDLQETEYGKEHAI
ncbi:hypothetical protein C9412_17150 [Stenotrophomonas sp. Nf1]|nr:hypothetical protein C9412_17150 [Stenotrophomonas sp. Nf1]PTA77381.1 hypothetical protein C9416_15925 [Stenotrophomonas sp. Nf4]